MAITGAFTDARLYVGPFDYTGFINNVALNYGTDILNTTVFGQQTTVNRAGLEDVSLTASGFNDLADDGVDERMFGNVGLANVPVTLMPQNVNGTAPAEGDRCYFFRSTVANYSTGGPVGAMLPWNFSAQCDKGDPFVPAYVLETGASAKTSSSNGTGSNNLGAVASGESLYAVLHVVATDTPTTLDVEIESASDAPFTSPTTRVTFTQVTTAVSAEYAAAVAGPITDTYWRAKWTIVGTSYTFAVAAGRK